MRENPDAIYARLLNFLELPPATDSFTNYFAQSYDEPMDPRLRAALSERFADLNADLCELLEIDIPEWCSSPVA